MNPKANQKIKVYLCGSITPNYKTRQWRNELTSIIDESLSGSIKIINPTKNGFNKTIESIKDYDEFFKRIDNTQNILKRIDYQLIKNSDVIICNVSIFDIQKPPIGTIYELAWADHHRIPVIGIISTEENPYIKHPWIRDSFAYSVYDVKGVVFLLKQFFVPFI